MVLGYLKRGAYTSLLYGASSGLVRIASFFCLPFFLHALTLQEFGLWDFYQLFFSLGTLLISSSTATAMTRYYLLYKDEQEKQRQSVGNAFLTAVVAALLCLGIGIVSVWSHVHIYTILTLLNISLFSLFAVFLAYLRVREFLWLYMACVVGQSLLALLLTLVGVWYGYGLVSFFYANGVSYLLFVPCFVYVWMRYSTYDRVLGKQQLIYSFPLLLNSLVFMGFFSLDRMVITATAGYETLGLYALLWRFGSVFQFCAIALYDAWVLMIFNAHKEQEGTLLIARLTNYVYLALACGVVASIMGAYGVISLYFPLQYQCLLAYVPVFFVALIFFELSRIFGAGFGLSATTAMMPVWAAVALGMQAGLLLMLQVFGLWGILCANLCAFAMHGMIRHWYGSKLYTPAIVDVPFITRTTVLMLGYSAVFHVLCWYSFSWPAFLVLGMTWPVAVWLFLLQEEEKEWLGTQLVHGMAWLARRIVPQSSAPRGADTILYLRTDLCSQEIKVGGSVAHTLGVLNGFKACGYEIVCASAAMPSLLRQQNVKAFYHLQVPPYLFFMRWKLGHLRWRLESCMASIVFAWQLRKVVRSTTYAYIYQRYSLLNCLGVLLSKALKTPLILEYNGSEVWAFEQWGDKKAWGKLTWLARAVERYNVTHADYIVVVSDVLRDELVARGIDAHKILVNPNGVDVQVYNPAVLEQARQELRSKQTIEEKFVVGFVGTFSYWHGIEVLASVIPAVVALQPQVHFLLIGDGPLKNYLLQELERHNVLDHVICTGFVPQYEAKNYLACCDAFISPTQPNTDGSRFFGSPTKLFEYVSMGKPVIVSDLEQLAEIVKPALSLYNQEPVTEQFGIVVQPDDIQGFVQAIVRLSLMDSDDRVRMGNNARNRAVEQFSWDNHVQKIHTFVQKK